MKTKQVPNFFQFYFVFTELDVVLFLRWMECYVMDPPQRTLHLLWLTAPRLKLDKLVSLESVSFQNQR